MSDSDRIATLVATAYDNQTFRPTLGEVRRRARGRLRRRLPAFLAALALLFVGGGTAVVVASGGGDFNADCEAQWAAAGRLGTMPSFVLSVGDRPGISVYAQGSTEFDCVHGSHVEQYNGQGSSFIYDRPFGPQLAVTGVVWDRSSVVYTGVTLRGTTDVELHFPESNRTYHAVLHDTHFGVEVPADTISETPLFSATGSFGVTVVQGPFLHSSPPIGPPAGQCGNSDYTDTPALAGIDTAAPPLVIDLSSREDPLAEVALAGSGHTIVLCGSGLPVAAFYAQDRPDVSPFTVYGTIAEPQGWMLGGRVPTGTTSVTVSMTDGSHIAATIKDGFWLAWNPSAQANGPTPILVAAISGTGIHQYHLGG